MKSKWFIDVRILAYVLFAMMFIPIIIVALWIYIVTFSFNNSFTDHLLLVLCYIVTPLMALIMLRHFGKRMASLLIVKENTITWKCLLYRSARIKLEDCKYVGIADFADDDRGCPVSRGDEMSYIYLCKDPFPDKYRHKIDRTTCKNNFIFFCYSDRLCRTLIDLLPEEKTRALVSFYQSLQATDRKIARKKELKKQKKLKKKLKKKLTRGSKKVIREGAMSNIIPVFGIDITCDKENESINGTGFISKTSSLMLNAEIENDVEILEQAQEESKLPHWIRAIKLVCGFYGSVTAVSTVKASFEVGFNQAIKNAPVLIISGFISLIVFFILNIISKKKAAVVLKEKGVEHQIEKINYKIQSISDDMDIPSDAVPTDILTFRYREKNGIVCAKSTSFQMTPYVNSEFKMFVKDDSLHLANLQNIYSFKLSELRAIKTINKRICIPSWNKTDDPRTGRFKLYKMTVNNFGFVFFRPYHILEIEHNGQLFGIYFPCYELETFEKFSELKAQKQ